MGDYLVVMKAVHLDVLMVVMKAVHLDVMRAVHLAGLKGYNLVYQ